MAENEEVWKDIPSYEGRYQVSTLGNVRSLNYQRTGKIVNLKQGRDRYGYCQVTLSNAGKPKSAKIHRLVATAFIPNPLNLPVINHKDENPLNNCVFIDDEGNVVPEKSNLEWCTQKYNRNYGTCNQRIIEKLNRPVCQYDREGKLVAEYASINEAVEKTGLVNVSAACRGVHKTAGEYTFSYAGEAPKEYHEPKNRPKRVVQYSLDGTRIAVFQTIREAGDRTGTNNVLISRCCDKNNPSNTTAGGFLWSLEGDEPKLFKLCDAMRPVYQYDREGKLVARYATMKEAATAVGSSVSSLRKCCIGAPHYNTAKGFRWAFAD